MQVRLISYKIYHQILTQRKAMLTSAQAIKEFREREAASPLREKPNSKFNPPNPRSDYSASATPNFQYSKPRTDIQENRATQTTGVGFKNEEKRPGGVREKREQHAHSCFNEMQVREVRTGNLNDFSFDGDCDGHLSQAQGVKRDNARMRGLELKMNNIDSLHEKINSLLSMVKRDRSRDRPDPNNDALRKNNQPKPTTQLTRPAVEPAAHKQKENQYSYQFMGEVQRERQDKFPNNVDRSPSPLRTKPLAARQENVEQVQAKPSSQQWHLKSTNELMETENEDFHYSPLSRNRRRQARRSELNCEETEHPQASPCRERSSNLELQKSIEEMLNERRHQRSLKEQEPGSSRNTPRQRKQPEEAAYDARSNGQLNQIRERIARLANPAKPEEGEEKPVTGRIYKKGEAATPTRAQYAYKKVLEIEVGEE